MFKMFSMSTPSSPSTLSSPRLVITIPKYSTDISSKDDEMRLIAKLKWLETAVCRNELTEEQRTLQLKPVTSQFLALLQVK